MRATIRVFIAVLFCAESLFGAFSIKTANAAEFDKFNNSQLIKFSETQIKHNFKINSVNHTVVYNNGKTFDKLVTYSGGSYSEKISYYKLTSSDYFETTGNYYLVKSEGLSSAQGSGVASTNYGVLEKINKEAYDEQLIQNRIALSPEWVVYLMERDGDYFAGIDQHNKPDGSDYQKEYLNYIASDSFNSNSVREINFSEVLDSYFSEVTYNVSIIDKGSLAPIIKLSGSTENNRPELTFRLTGVGGWSGLLSSEENNFYFTYLKKDDASVDDVFMHVAMKIMQEGNGHIVYKADNNQNNDENLLGGKALINVNKTTWLDYVINRVYNGKSEGESSVCGSTTVYDKTASPAYTEEDLKNTSYRRCINADTNGWLAKWGVTYVKASVSNPTGKTNVCGSTTWSTITGGIGGLIRSSICNLALLIHEFATSFVDGAIKAFGNSIGLEAGY